MSVVQIEVPKLTITSLQLSSTAKQCGHFYQFVGHAVVNTAHHLHTARVHFSVMFKYGEQLSCPV